MSQIQTQTTRHKPPRRTASALRLRKGDVVLMGLILLLVLLFWGGLTLFSTKGRVAVVTLDGAEICRVSLKEEQEIPLTTPLGDYLLVVRKEALYVASAPCPDLICAHHAPISRAGETILCLPSRLAITVVDQDTVLLPPIPESCVPEKQGDGGPVL